MKVRGWYWEIEKVVLEIKRMVLGIERMMSGSDGIVWRLCAVVP